MGLNDSYSQAKSQIPMIIPTPSVSQTYAMLVQDKSQQDASGMLNLEEMALNQQLYSQQKEVHKWDSGIRIITICIVTAVT